MNNPKVTVLMAVYNAEQYLQEAMDSILNQTFIDFEFLIINDASTDKSVDIIRSYDDSRVRLIHNEKNLKLAATLNKGIDLAKGKYIARMDADDISLPERLEKQVNFMDENQDVDICGTLVKTMGLTQNFVFNHPIDSNEIKVGLLFQNVLAHPSIIMRKESLLKHNLRYDSNFIYAQDYDMWSRCSKVLNLANIKEVLLKYRCNDKIINIQKKIKQREYAMQIFKNNLKDLDINNDEFIKCFHKKNQLDLRNFYTIIDGLKEIILKNKEKKIYMQETLDQYISNEIEEICFNSTYLGLSVLKKYYIFFQNEKEKFVSKRFLKFFIKCVIKYKKVRRV